MKKLFTTAIAICLLLSFCVTGFAGSLTITHLYKGKSLTEGDPNEYFYAFVKYDGEETPEAFGVIIDGEKYPLSEEELVKAQQDKKFGIGIADPENKLTNLYTVIPYVTVNGEDILGNENIVDKCFFYEKMTSHFEGYANDAISDDTNSKTNRYNDWYAPTGIYMQTNIHNGLGYGFNEALARALIQIDLTKFDGIDPTQPVMLSVVGRAQYSAATATPETLPETMTVNAYGFYEFDWSKSAPGYVWPEEGEEDTTEPVYTWSESSVNPAAGYIGPRLEEIYKMPLLDSFTVDVPENTENKTSGDVVAPNWETKSVDIKDIVAAAIKAGQTKVTVVLLADNSERENLPNKNEAGDLVLRDEVIFNMGTKENGTESRRPTITYYQYDEVYTELSAIKVNGEEIEGFDPETTEYTVNTVKGNGVPYVSATLANEESRAVITQATNDNNFATIKVYDEQNIRSKTYKITFVESVPSEQTTIKSAITADAHSRVNEIPPYSVNTSTDATKDNSASCISFYTNLYNGVAYATGNEATLKRGYIKVDVSQLPDVDLTKKIYLNIYGKATIGASTKTDKCPDKLKVNVYAAMKSEFKWDEAIASKVTVNTFGPDLTPMKALPLVDVITVPEALYNTDYDIYNVDITEGIRKAIENKEEYVTFIFSADNSERNTAELQALKEANGNNRDNVTFTVLTKERTVAAQQPSVTYSKYDSKYTDLTAIAINGEAIKDFASDKFEYISSVEDGSELPVVTATAFDKDATVEIDQPSDENGYAATITVSNKNMTDKVYKVFFKPVISNNLADVITDDLTSRTEESYKEKQENGTEVTKYRVLTTADTMFTNISNGAGNGWDAALRRAYTQIDLTKFEDIENIQNVYLSIMGYASLSSGRKSENAPSEIKIDVYGIPSTQFNTSGAWSETTVKNEVEAYRAANNKELSSVGPTVAQTKGFELQDSFVIDLYTKDNGDLYADRARQTVDITKIIKDTLNANAKLEDASKKETKITIIFMADNTSRAGYPNVTGTASTPDDVYYRIHTKDTKTPAYMPSISYTTYDSSIANLSGIEVGGTAISDFDTDTLNYTASFADGEDIPEVTATALYPDATVTVNQATGANGYKATITVANEGVTSKVYTVTFNIVKKSTVVETKTAIIGDTGSYPSEVNYANGVTSFTNIANGWPLTWASSGLKRIYIQVGLDELTDADYNKDIILNVTGKTVYSPNEVDPDDYPATLTINAYGALPSDFPWSETDVNTDKPKDLGPNLSNTVKLPLLHSFTVDVPGYVDQSAELSGNVTTKQVNITEFAREAYKKGNKYITVILFADNTDFISKPRDTYLGRIKYTMYTKEYTSVASWVPYVTYSKFNSEYTDLTSIALNGVNLEDFAADTYEYEVTLSEGQEIPVVTATGSALADIKVVWEGNIATITVSVDDMASKNYTVTFKAPVVD